MKLFGLFKRAWILLLLTYTISNNIYAQCDANFSYTIDSVNGMVGFTNLSVPQDTLTPVFFTWYSQPSVPLSSDTNPVIQLDPGTHNICLKISNGGCTDSICMDIIMPEIYCKAAYSYVVDQNTRTVDYTNASTGVNLTYYWSFADGTYSMSQNPSHTFTSNGWYYVCLNIINVDSSCMNSSCEFVKIDKLNPTPCDADFIFEIDTVNPKLVHFYNNTSGDTGITYFWLLAEDSSSLENPSHEYSDTGYFTVCLLVSGQNCADSVCKTVEIFPVITVCDASFTYNLYPDSGSNKTSRIAIFSNSSTGNNLSYTWNFGDGSAASTMTSPLHYYPADGDYTVCLTAYNMAIACKDSVCKVLTIATDSLTGLESKDFLLNNINVYPVPFTDLLTVDFSSVTSGRVKLNIYDMIGKTRYTTQGKTEQGLNHMEIITSGLTKGLYFLELESENGSKTVRIIK
jgi:PKD repeat protein